MITKNPLSSLAPAITVLVLALGVWLFLRNAQEGVASFNTGVLAGFMPTVWISVWALRRKTRSGGNVDAMLTGSISLAGIILAVAMGLALAGSYHLIAGMLSDRLFAVMLGGFLVLVGNTLPKTLKPLGAGKCASAKEQSLRRFAGWMFVLAGLGYALAWLVLPVHVVKPVAISILMAPVLLALLRIFMVRFQRATS